MRETKLAAVKPEGIAASASCSSEPTTVVYQGPLRQIVDDFGNVYLRGVPTPVALEAWKLLEATGTAPSFVVFDGESAKGGCCS